MPALCIGMPWCYELRVYKSSCSGFAFEDCEGLQYCHIGRLGFWREKQGDGVLGDI